MTEFLIKVEKRLKTVFGDETNAFKALLDETGAVVSGSIIVQAILGEEWEDSDIDVYIPANPIQSPSGNPSSKIDEWLLNKLGWQMTNYLATNRYGDNMSRGQDITWIRNFACGKKAIPSVQLIHTRLNREELNNYIDANFDFVICKNVYSVNGGETKLSLTDVNAIQKKEFPFEFAGNIFGSLSRAEKYSNRGFKINMDSRKVLDEILAFQQTQLNLEDHEKKSHSSVRVCQEDISQHDRRFFRIWTKNIEDYDMNEAELLKRGTAETSHLKNYCPPACPFTMLGFKHFHTQGKHLGHAQCENLIVLNK